MFFSIVMPVYNVACYLKEAINSVLVQAFNDYELILVNDGSTDECPRICDEYAQNNWRIRVIHKKNGGLSDARNVGTRSAVGKYIMYVDSDDILEENALRFAYEELYRSDFPEVLVANMLHYKNGIVLKKYDIDCDKVLKGTFMDTIREYVKQYRYIPWAAYQNVYKREFLIKNDIFFDATIIGAEDCDFFMRLHEKVDTFTVSNMNMVLYRMGREGSIITTPKMKAVYGQLKVFSDKFHCFLEKDDSIFIRYFANKYANIIVLIGYLEKDDAKHCVELINANRDILNYTSLSLKYIAARVVWFFFGYYSGSRLLNKLRG